MKLIRTENHLNSNRYWTMPVKNYVFHPKAVALFDQNGYDLTEVEQEYAKVNGYTPKEHRHFPHLKFRGFPTSSISKSIFFNKPSFDKNNLNFSCPTF